MQRTKRESSSVVGTPAGASRCFSTDSDTHAPGSRASIRYVIGSGKSPTGAATGTPTSQLRFIEDAWRQVIRSSKRLKWTYAYGYYHFGIAKDAKKKEFFEFLQGEAERNLLRLKDFLDKDLKEVTDEE